MTRIITDLVHSNWLEKTHVQIVAIVAGAGVLGVLLHTLLSPLGFSVWIAGAVLALAVGISAVVVRLGGGLASSLIAGYALGLANIYSFWTGGPWGGSNAIESTILLGWAGWYFALVLIPASVLGFAVGGVWVYRSTGDRTRSWVLSRTSAAVVLTTLLWLGWFYWFGGMPLGPPGPPPV
jgi:hypothetical protein